MLLGKKIHNSDYFFMKKKKKKRKINQKRRGKPKTQTERRKKKNKFDKSRKPPTIDPLTITLVPIKQEDRMVTFHILMDRDDKRGGSVLIPISKILYFVFVWKLFIEISALGSRNPKLKQLGWAAFLFVSCCVGWKKRSRLRFPACW